MVSSQSNKEMARIYSPDCFEKIVGRCAAAGPGWYNGHNFHLLVFPVPCLDSSEGGAWLMVLSFHTPELITNSNGS